MTAKIIFFQEVDNILRDLAAINLDRRNKHTKDTEFFICFDSRLDQLNCLVQDEKGKDISNKIKLKKPRKKK